MGYQLIIDTSSKYLAVGIADDHEVLYKVQYLALQKQSELATLEIEKALKTLDIDSRELSRIIVTKGPGSYTGVRIGLTIAKVMSYVHNIPVCAVSTLQSLAGVEPKAIALLDARSDKVYVGVYDFGKEKVKEKIVEATKVKDILNTHPEYTVFGDRELAGLLSVPVDILENMFRVSKNHENEKYVDTLVPVYLKD